MKIPKKRFFAYLFLIYLILALPLVYAVIVGPRHVYVSITISNQAPLITNVTITPNPVTPIENGTVKVVAIINVTDVDGTGNINANTIKANVSRNGVVRGNSSFNCVNAGNSNASSSIFNCSILIYYYDNASTAWQVNVSISDNANASNVNFSSTALEISTLSAVQLNRNAITFGSASLGTANVEASVVVNNTGNDPFLYINVTAYDLNNSDGTEFFRIFGNFSVNATQNAGGAGRALLNRTQVNVPIGSGAANDNATLPITGPTGAGGFQTVYFYVDIPTTGLSTGTVYNSTPPGWEIRVQN